MHRYKYIDIYILHIYISMTCGVDHGKVQAVIARVLAGGLRHDHREDKVAHGLFQGGVL